LISPDGLPIETSTARSIGLRLKNGVSLVYVEVLTIIAVHAIIVLHQATVAERFMQGLHLITGNANNLLARRPFFVFWFMGQISRSLTLWECDNSLLIALDVCKALLPAID